MSCVIGTEAVGASGSSWLELGMGGETEALEREPLPNLAAGPLLRCPNSQLTTQAVLDGQTDHCNHPCCVSIGIGLDHPKWDKPAPGVTVQAVLVRHDEPQELLKQGDGCVSVRSRGHGGNEWKVEAVLQCTTRHVDVCSPNPSFSPTALS
jgi:hypothetical protein